MKRSLSLFLLPAVLMLSVEVSGADKKKPLQNYPLDENLIAMALAEGTRAKGGFLGLSLLDSEGRVGSALLQGLTQGQEAGSLGFSLSMFSPYTWIAQKASWESKKYRSLSRDQVTDDMLRGVLRVYANPNMPAHVTAQGMAGASGVEHVVLKSVKRTRYKNSEGPFVIAQPLDLVESEEYVQNAFGAKVALASMEATFSIEDVLRISEVDKKGEFFVVVIGVEGKEREFKIKTKHFSRLR